MLLPGGWHSTLGRLPTRNSNALLFPPVLRGGARWRSLAKTVTPVSRNGDEIVEYSSDENNREIADEIACCHRERSDLTSPRRCGSSSSAAGLAAVRQRLWSVRGIPDRASESRTRHPHERPSSLWRAQIRSARIGRKVASEETRLCPADPAARKSLPDCRKLAAFLTSRGRSLALPRRDRW